MHQPSLPNGVGQQQYNQTATLYTIVLPSASQFHAQNPHSVNQFVYSTPINQFGSRSSQIASFNINGYNTSNLNQIHDIPLQRNPAITHDQDDEKKTEPFEDKKRKLQNVYESKYVGIIRQYIEVRHRSYHSSISVLNGI